MNACIYKIIYFITCFSYINCQCYVDTSYLNGVYDEKFETNHLICDPPPLDAVITVNTFKNDKQLYSSSNPYASACVKCLLCSTVAEHMQKMLMSLHTIYPPTNLFNSAKLNSTMRYFCNNGFKNFDFQEENGVRFLAVITQYSKHVPSEIDGKWPAQLKQMCHEFMDNAGEQEVYIRWYYGSRNIHFDITDMLCRSYGIFQHCRNVPFFAKLPFEMSCYS